MEGSFAWIDLVGLGLFAAFALLGFARGLWWQVIRLIGIVVAVLVARAASPQVAPWIQEQWPSLSLRVAHGAGWLAVFLAAMVAATLLGFLGRRLLEAMKLGLADRVGGAVAGSVTGVLIHLALLIGICQLASESFVRSSVSGTYSEKLVDTLGARWPVALASEAGAELDRLLQRARGAEGDIDRGEGWGETDGQVR